MAKQLTGLIFNITVSTTSLVENMEEVNAMELRFVALQKEIYGLAVEKNEKDKQAKQLNQRHTEIKQKLGVLESRKEMQEERIEVLREDIDTQEASLHQNRRRIDEISTNIDSFEDNITLAGTQITENDRKAADYEAQILDVDNQRANLQKDLESITEDIVTELDLRLKDAGYSSSNCAFDFSERKSLPPFPKGRT